jgi:hypothetical protein
MVTDKQKLLQHIRQKERPVTPPPPEPKKSKYSAESRQILREIPVSQLFKEEMARIRKQEREEAEALKPRAMTADCKTVNAP